MEVLPFTNTMQNNQVDPGLYDEYIAHVQQMQQARREQYQAMNPEERSAYANAYAQQAQPIFRPMNIPPRPEMSQGGAPLKTKAFLVEVITTVVSAYLIISLGALTLGLIAAGFSVLRGNTVEVRIDLDAPDPVLPAVEPQE